MQLLGRHVCLLLTLARVSALQKVEVSAQGQTRLKQEDERVSPRNFVISCREDDKRLKRFRRHMETAGLDFEVFPCVEPSLEYIRVAVEEGLLGPLALQHYSHHSGFLGVALAHMKLLQNLSASGVAAANIFEDDEVVHDDYKEKRSQVLATLPADAEFVNMNPLRPAGEMILSKEWQIHHLHPGLPANSNVWLSNYYVSSAGARRLLNLLRGFDAGASGPREVDWKLAAAFGHGSPELPGGGFFSLTTDVLSKHCQVYSTKDKLNNEKTMLPSHTDPVCLE